MSFSIADLLRVLDLDRVDETTYRGRSPKVGWQRTFGGLVVSQALVAAARTVPDRTPHSLHGYFMLPGDPEADITFEVEKLRDGRSFSTRQTMAIQHGQPIFCLSASFQVPEQGFDHQVDMPDVPMPETLIGEADLLALPQGAFPDAMRLYLQRERPVELRPVDFLRYMKRSGGRPSRQNIWMRAKERLPDDPATHQALLAYMSDLTLLDAALVIHDRSIFEPTLQVASLDHSLWFHRPFRADEWLLYAQDSPTTSGGRGLSRGLISTCDGVLVASVAQEGLIRERRST